MWQSQIPLPSLCLFCLHKFFCFSTVDVRDEYLVAARWRLRGWLGGAWRLGWRARLRTAGCLAPATCNMLARDRGYIRHRAPACRLIDVVGRLIDIKSDR